MYIASSVTVPAVFPVIVTEHVARLRGVSFAERRVHVVALRDTEPVPL
jgi:hypothetical protein